MLIDSTYPTSGTVVLLNAKGLSYQSTRYVELDFDLTEAYRLF